MPKVRLIVMFSKSQLQIILITVGIFVCLVQNKITRAGSPYDACIEPSVKNVTRDVYEELYPTVSYSEQASMIECHDCLLLTGGSLRDLKNI
jgi:nitrate/TMAO reductase-like tetraheme cytochrome c subunit